MLIPNILFDKALDLKAFYKEWILVWVRGRIKLNLQKEWIEVKKKQDKKGVYPNSTIVELSL